MGQALTTKIKDEICHPFGGIEIIKSELIPEGKMVLLNMKYRSMTPALGEYVVSFNLEPGNEVKAKIKKQLKDLGFDE